MFVDASAIVAILLREPGYERLEKNLIGCPNPVTSGLAIYEAVLAVARFKKNFPEAEASVWSFMRLMKFEIVAIDEAITHAALSAFARYGKGQGHPAQLNMGDCFAYAGAKTRGVPLLFVGNDFAQTDIHSASA